ncbi:MAG: NUDIX hydrolase [Gammaproteobacteria bacterium]|nr:NUDIX hydrolase [Gammaproteobacteria bacterium]
MKYCPECAGRLEAKIIDSVERKVCTQLGCDFVFWDNPTPVVAMLVEYQSGIILARNSKWDAGLFSVLTGFLEKNQSPEQAALSEVKQELGLDGQIKKFIGHYALFETNQIILAFAVAAHGALKINHEIAEVKIFTQAAIATYSFGRFAVTRAIVQDWLAQPPSRN